jgi:hypothetical protein
MPYLNNGEYYFVFTCYRLYMKYIADGNYFNIVGVEDTILFFNSSDENIFVSSTLCLQSRIRSKQRCHHIISRILFLSPRIYKVWRGLALLTRPGRGMCICVETTVE